MSDFLVDLGANPTARNIIKSLGLPIPMPQQLARGNGAYEAQPLKGKTVVVGAADGGTAGKQVAATIEACGATVKDSAADKVDVLVFDATGVSGAADLKALYSFFHPAISNVKACGRIVVLARVPELVKDLGASVAARSVEGFVRSAAKEVGKRGATANLIYVEKGAEAKIDAPLRFFASTRSAFVDGQAVRVTKAVDVPADAPASKVLAGKVALVTGAARGIGEATATRLAAEGAHVVCLDVPFDLDTLNATTAKVGGTALPMDITDAEAPRKIADFLKDKFGGVDIVVHNAGVTRDKTLARMKEQFWDMVININLAAILAIDEVLFGEDVINDGGRVVCLSSIGGIAGNMGQTNYGLTKAGVIGYVQAQSKAAAKKGITVNAVAPGFIETRMTAAMPVGIREAGRRLSSLSQGGQPQDVAELITFLSTPGSAGVTGNVVRVCGQSLVGA